MAARKKGTQAAAQVTAQVPEPEPDTPKEEEIVETLVWEGIEIQARYRPRYIGTAHLELHVASKAPIPVTDTGYRSCFDPRLPQHIEEAGGVAAFTKNWLDASAKSQAWQAHLKAKNTPTQLDLFG